MRASRKDREDEAAAGKREAYKRVAVARPRLVEGPEVKLANVFTGGISYEEGKGRSSQGKLVQLDSCYGTIGWFREPRIMSSDSKRW